MTCLTLLVASLGYLIWGYFLNERQDRADETARTLVAHAADRALEDPVGAALLAVEARRTSDLPGPGRP